MSTTSTWNNTEKIGGRLDIMHLVWLLQAVYVAFCPPPPTLSQTHYGSLGGGWRGGLVVGRRTCDLVVAGSRPGRDAAA